MEHDIKVGDRFNIGPYPVQSWVSEPRVITSIRHIPFHDGYAVCYTLDSGRNHSVSLSRLMDYIRTGEWVRLYPSQLRIPAGA